MRIDWGKEILRARTIVIQNECCSKFISLAEQIYEELKDQQADTDYYRDKAIDYLERSQGLTNSYAKEVVGERPKRIVDTEIERMKNK